MHLHIWRGSNYFVYINQMKRLLLPLLAALALPAAVTTELASSPQITNRDKAG